jgi:hypothetical protein
VRYEPKKLLSDINVNEKQQERNAINEKKYGSLLLEGIK